MGKPCLPTAERAGRGPRANIACVPGTAPDLPLPPTSCSCQSCLLLPQEGHQPQKQPPWQPKVCQEGQAMCSVVGGVFTRISSHLLLSANLAFSRKREIVPDSEHPFFEVRYISLYIRDIHMCYLPKKEQMLNSCQGHTWQHQSSFPTSMSSFPKADLMGAPAQVTWWHPGDTQSLTYAALSTSPARIVGVRKILRPPFAPSGGKCARAGDSHLAGQETRLQTRREKIPSMELHWKTTR